MARQNKVSVPAESSFRRSANLQLTEADIEEIPVVFGEAIIVDHDDIFYTKTETDELLDTKANQVALTEEENARLAVEAELSNRIEAEKSERIEVCNNLHYYADDINALLHQETLDRESGDTALASNIDNEISNRRSNSGHSIELSLDASDFKLTAKLKDAYGNYINGAESTVDLPLETMVVSGRYDDQNKAIVLTLQNGTTVTFGVADLVSNLASSNALSAEQQARISADITLNDAIARIDGSQQNVDAQINELSTRIETEQNERSTADNALYTQINLKAAETETAAQEYTDTAIANLSTALQNAITEVNTNINGLNDEVQTKTSELTNQIEAIDQATQASLGIETSTREAAVNDLLERIDQESTIRQAADDQLSARMNNYVPKSREIAGCALDQDIFPEQLRQALGFGGTLGNIIDGRGVGSLQAGSAADANYDNSYAFGYLTRSGRENQFVVGRANKIDADALFVVGCGGTFDNERENAFAVYGQYGGHNVALKLGDVRLSSTTLQALINLNPSSGKQLSTNDYTEADKAKLDSISLDAIYTKPATGIPVTDLADDVSAILTMATADHNRLSDFALVSETGNKLDVSMDDTDYKITFVLKDKNDNSLSSQTIDLPLESVVVSGAYDSNNNKIVLTLRNGGTIEFSVASLVDGLVNQSAFDAHITNFNSHIADATLHITDAERQAWNNKYTKPANGIVLTDLSANVQNLLINKLNIHNGEGIQSLAQGGNIITRADYAATFGYVNQNYGIQSFVEGAENINGARIDEDGILIIDTTGHKGQASHIEGWANENHAYASHIEGCHNIANENAEYSHVEGDNNRLEAYAGHIEGCANKIFRYARQTHVEGYQNEGYGFETHVEGWNNKGGPYSATDYDETVTYQIGDTVKYLTTAGYVRYYACVQECTGQTPEDNLTYWQMTRAQHAEGIGTEAVGNGAHSQGGYTKAKYDYSMAGGYYTITGRDIQTVLGKYNAEDTEALFVIGDGIANNQRSNAFAVGNDGTNPYIKIGDVKLTNADLTILKGLADTKVDKVAGMGLSSNDFNATYKEKLESIAYGATQVYVDTELGDSTNHAIANKTVKDALSNKVDKVSGKGLSTNDFTDALKTKLEDLPLEKGTLNNSVVMPNCTATTENGVALGTYNVDYSVSTTPVGSADTSWYNEEEAEFTLTTPEQFLGFMALCYNGTRDSFAGVTIKLGADIDLNPGKHFHPTIANNTVTFKSEPAIAFKNTNTPAAFKGILDGQGHSLSGMYTDRGMGDRNKFGGMFDYLYGTIQNLAIVNSFFRADRGTNWGSTDQTFGGIAAYFESGSKLSNVYFDAEVWFRSDNHYTFGMLGGYFRGTTIENVTVRGRFAVAGASNDYGHAAAQGSPSGYLCGHANGSANTLNKVLVDVIKAAPKMSGSGGTNNVNWLCHYGNGSTTGADTCRITKQTTAPTTDWVWNEFIESYIPCAADLPPVSTTALFQYGMGTAETPQDGLLIGERQIIGDTNTRKLGIGIGNTFITERELQKLLTLIH